MEVKSPIDLHLFVCTNKNPDKEKCADFGGEIFWARLKERLKPLGKAVRVNKAGCLGACSKGAVAVVYPEAKWFYKLDDQLVEEIGNYIEREVKNV